MLHAPLCYKYIIYFINALETLENNAGMITLTILNSVHNVHII